MKKITTAIIMAISLTSVSAFAAPNFEQQASTAASETIKYQQQASVARQQVMDACRQSKDALHNAIKDLSPEDKKAFMKEYRYQMRQQVAKLGRDDAYDEFVCGANKPPKGKHPNKKKAKKSPKPKDSVLKPVE
ncbi:MAG: hypothetical protein IIU35_02965 [Neisseriaceae bacterium]|nr:hypothetical protein [Neisseriaceae bacterium]